MCIIISNPFLQFGTTRLWETRWTIPTDYSILSSPIVADGVVYIGSQDHKLYALDARKGTKYWTFTTGDVIDSSPTIVNGVVYINVGDGKLYAFHLSS